MATRPSIQSYLSTKTYHQLYLMCQTRRLVPTIHVTSSLNGDLVGAFTVDRLRDLLHTDLERAGWSTGSSSSTVPAVPVVPPVLSSRQLKRRANEYAQQQRSDPAKHQRRLDGKISKPSSSSSSSSIKANSRILPHEDDYDTTTSLEPTRMPSWSSDRTQKHQTTTSANSTTVDGSNTKSMNNDNKKKDIEENEPSDIASVSSLPSYARYILRWLPPPLVTIISHYATPSNRVAALWQDICTIAGVEQSTCGASQQRIDDLQRDLGDDVPLHHDLRALLEVSDGVYNDHHPISVMYPSVSDMRQQLHERSLFRSLYRTMQWNPFGDIDADHFKVIDIHTGGIYIIDTTRNQHTVVTTSLSTMIIEYHKLLCQYANDEVTLQQQRRRAMQRIQHRHFQATDSSDFSSSSSSSALLPLRLERAESAARLEASLEAASRSGPRVDDKVLQAQLRGCHEDDPPLTLKIAFPSIADKLTRTLNLLLRHLHPRISTGRRR
jgi:hypothetical protein